MQMLRRGFDRWLFDEYRTDPESLAIFRIFFATFVLVNEFPTGLWTEPAVAYSPPVSFAAFFTGPPPHWLMVALNLATMLSAASLLVGLYTVASSFAVAFGTIVINSFCFADGKIDEGLVIWVALILARSGWGGAFSVDRFRGRASPADTEGKAWLVTLLTMVIGFALFTAGSAKLHGGWLSPNAYGTRYHLFWDYYVFGRKTPLATWAWGHLPAFAWKAGDISTVLWEVGFVLTVARRSWCRLACAAGAFFHFGVWHLFDIEVTSNVVAYSVLVDWARVSPTATDWLRRITRAPASAGARVLCALPFVFAVASLFVFPRELNALISSVTSKLVLTAGLLGAIYYVISRVREAAGKTLAPSPE
jgi:uncharacterized membrane protein YphA (DoxX/SURF4 family)